MTTNSKEQEEKDLTLLEFKVCWLRIRWAFQTFLLLSLVSTYFRYVTAGLSEVTLRMR